MEFEEGAMQGVWEGFLRKRRYPARLLFSCVSLILLSAVDGCMTLLLIGFGARELNPVMRSLLEIGPWFFLIGKFTITSFCAFILLLLHHKRFFFGKLRVSSLLSCARIPFILVIFWEMYLVAMYT